MAILIEKDDPDYKGKNVRLINSEQEMLGVVTYQEARDMAIAEGFDLVEIAGNSEPRVVRLMNFGKYVYKQKKKKKMAKKCQVTQKLKEVKFHINIDEHDYQTKLKHGVEFINKGNKLKVTIVYRGREMAYRDQGYAFMEKIKEDFKNIAVIDMPAKLQGRNMTMQLAPIAKK